VQLLNSFQRSRIWCLLKLVCRRRGTDLESLAIDLESFAGHAKRSIINVEDVKVFSL
jgi:histone H3/H4